MRKDLAILGSVMLVAATVPIAVAHNDNAQPGPKGNAPAGSEEVFGWYHGTASVLSETSFVGANGRQCGANCGGVGPISLVATTCDLEVQDANSGVAEPIVDGNPGGSTGAPEGTFHDGGFGGACHTESQYANNDWNTPGCSDLNSNGVNDHVGGQDRALAAAHPNDDNELDTFVLASCDSETRNGEGLVTCVVNAGLGGKPVQDLQECPDRIDPGTPDPGVFLSCGSDGSGDYVTGGYVDEDAPKAKNNFPAPTTGPNCVAGSGGLILFVLVGADAVTGKVSVATTGWVGTLNK